MSLPGATNGELPTTSEEVDYSKELDKNCSIVREALDALKHISTKLPTSSDAYTVLISSIARLRAAIAQIAGNRIDFHNVHTDLCNSIYMHLKNFIEDYKTALDVTSIPGLEGKNGKTATYNKDTSSYTYAQSSNSSKNAVRTFMLPGVSLVVNSSTSEAFQSHTIPYGAVYNAINDISTSTVSFAEKVLLCHTLTWSWYVLIIGIIDIAFCKNHVLKRRPMEDDLRQFLTSKDPLYLNGFSSLLRRKLGELTELTMGYRSAVMKMGVRSITGGGQDVGTAIETVRGLANEGISGLDASSISKMLSLLDGFRS